MENPFEIIIEKLNAIENRIKSIESKIAVTTNENGSSLDIMSLNQLCEFYDFGKSYVYKKTSNREIPYYKNGKRLYFKRIEIDEWLLDNRIKTNKDIEREVSTYLMRKKK